MHKTITSNQIIGEIGETAVRQRFLSIGFQFDGRSRLEAGIDGIAEVMDDGQPMARMIAVQVKATESSSYASENDSGFNYLLREKDLEYWRSSNLPVIIVLYRMSDETFFWQEVPNGISQGERRLKFNKERDVLDRNAVNRLADITVPKTGVGYYVPPLGGGEDALVNILPITLPPEIFVASTSYSSGKAVARLIENEEPSRFDWVIRGGSFWSFQDPTFSSCRDIVDLDQVEAIETSYLAFHEDIDEQNNFAFLLKTALKHQVWKDLGWRKEGQLLYFKAFEANKPRKYHYESWKNKASSEVVNVIMSKKEEGRVEFVRHHAFVPRFERLDDQWFLVITPTYYFTTNGFTPHSYPQALLSGKKRLDNSASLRGQVIMWHRYLTRNSSSGADLFEEDAESETCLKFGEPPQVALETSVPEDVWAASAKKVEESDDEPRLAV